MCSQSNYDIGNHFWCQQWSHNGTFASVIKNGIILHHRTGGEEWRRMAYLFLLGWLGYPNRQLLSLVLGDGCCWIPSSDRERRCRSLQGLGRRDYRRNNSGRRAVLCGESRLGFGKKAIDLIVWQPEDLDGHCSQLEPRCGRVWGMRKKEQEVRKKYIRELWGEKIEQLENSTGRTMQWGVRTANTAGGVVARKSGRCAPDGHAGLRPQS